MLYVLAASFILISIVVHEQAHYVAREGFGLPPIELHGSEAEAESSVRGRVAEGAVVVFFPDTLVQSLTLGLVPGAADGTLAATYMEETRGDIDAAPVWVALGSFAFLAAWTLVRPSLVARAALFASAVAVGNVVHHMDAAGLGAAGGWLAAGAVVVATTIVIVRGQTVQALLPPRRRVERTPQPPPIRTNGVVCRNRDGQGLN